MTFVSFAQNLEDVMLWRVFKHIEKGFYIDVGAQDPVIDSVTKAFYDAGWRGINIEPSQQYYEKLCIQRPEDINLGIAVSDKLETLPYYEIANSGLSTLNKDIAEIHKSNGWDIQEKKITALTLADICESYVRDKTIHFLKIDVEGGETNVLQGINFDLCRPYIVVVESTLPLLQKENYQQWEHILLNHKYQFVYFDGLNRFYVANEHIVLASKFYAPPNFFDDYVQNNQGFLVRLKQEFDERKKNVESELAKKIEQLEALEQTNQYFQQTIVQLKSKLLAMEKKEVLLQEILSSKSWRMTKPLREMMALVKKIKHKIISLKIQKKSTAIKLKPRNFLELLKNEIAKRERR